MFRHVVLFRFDPATTDAQKQSIKAGLEALPGLIPELIDYRVGFDAGVNEGNYEFAVVADTASLEDYLVYRDHPAHQQVIAERIKGVVSDRAALQYEL